MFLLHNDLFSVISIRHRCRFVCMIPILWTGHYSSYFVYCVVYANQIMIFSTSAAHVPLVLSCLLNPNALAADFEQVIVPVICFLVICFMPCLLTRHWFVSCPQHMCHQFRLLCIYGVLADFEQVIIPVLLYLLLLLTRHWFVECQQHLCIRVILQYNSGSCALGLSCSIILVQQFNTFIFHLGTVYLHHFR